MGLQRCFGMGKTSSSVTGYMLAIVVTASGCATSAHAAESLEVPAAAEVYIEERLEFTQALEAIRRNDKDTDQYLQRLQDYPLYDFLRFEQLRRSINNAPPTAAMVDQINDFEQTTGHRSLSRRLTRTLQRRYVETAQWEPFLSISRSRFAAKMRCATLRARWALGQISSFTKEVEALWTEPKQHRQECQKVLDAIEQRFTPSVAVIWEKIYQAMAADKPQFAEPLLTYLASGDRSLVSRWIEAYQDPKPFLLSEDLDKDTVLNRRIITDLVVQWSRQDTIAAMNHWLTERNNYVFFSDRYYDTHRAIAMRGAYRRMPEAYQWLYSFTARQDDLELQEWRIRTALLAEDWQAVLRSIGELPEEEQIEDHWAYWHARALEQLGFPDKARIIYQQLSGLQSYHGFLSADQLGIDYTLYDQAIEVSDKDIVKLSTTPALVRAREFHYVGLPHESRREWNNWMTGKPQEDLAKGAVLAMNWGLYDRAIYSAGQTDYKRALSVRFPILYRTEVAKAAMEHSIEPAWILGVMRRESAFIREIRSGAGAVGLMQLMPKTAQYVAKLLGDSQWRGDLTNAQTNVNFGAFYLRYVSDQFGGHSVLATAGYNAGPHRVDQWLTDSVIDADIWIDTIPFTETRRYVRAVLAYAAIYEFHLTGKPQPISSKLLPVPASPDA